MNSRYYDGRRIVMIFKKIFEVLKKPRSATKGQRKDNPQQQKPHTPVLTKHEALASFIQATDGQSARNLNSI